jgi:hypothetical protein
LLRDLGLTEVGGFGISAADDLLFVEDIQMVKQNCTPASVHFEDQSVADFFDRQVDAGLRPERFSRIWIHTHPDDSPRPSSTDERTFRRVFGPMEWAVMFILARGGQTFARLRFNVGPGGELTIPVSVDYSRPFAAANWELWREEYAANLLSIEPLSGRLSARAKSARATASNRSETARLDANSEIRFIRAEVVGGRSRSERHGARDPFFDPERRKAFDDDDFYRQGYFYDE